MQTFLPFADFQQSAAVLDNDRLGKQRVECLQILTALSCGSFQKLNGDKWVSCSTEQYQPFDTYMRKTPWYKHTATQMWKGYEKVLYHCYMPAIVAEWLKRGYKDTCYEKARAIAWDNGITHQSLAMPWWLGYEPFHASHRAVLLGKREWHYKHFGWSEKPARPVNKKYPYVWPTQLPADVIAQLKQNVQHSDSLSVSPVLNS